MTQDAARWNRAIIDLRSNEVFLEFERRLEELRDGSGRRIVDAEVKTEEDELKAFREIRAESTAAKKILGILTKLMIPKTEESA